MDLVAEHPAGRVPAATNRGECAGFTARSQADLVKITALDAKALHPGLPALLDVRLASAQGTANSSTRPHRTVATARFADAKLLGARLPGSAAIDKAPSSDENGADDKRATHERAGAGEKAGADEKADAGEKTNMGERAGAGERTGTGEKGDGGPVTATLAKLDTGGLVAAEAGKSTAEARWDDAYTCGQAGPLTRSATMLAGVSLLSGGGRMPAMQAVDRGTGADRRTSLLRVGPTGSTQSATDVIRLSDGRRGVAAGAGAALGDITLFGGTPQEISAKVVNQPTLTVVAGGVEPRIEYRPATLRVTAGGKPVTTLTAGHTSVGLDLFGRVTGAEKVSALAVKLSLGELRRKVGGNGAQAEVAALRLEVTLGRVHVLDVAIGYLFAEASSRPMTTYQRKPQQTTKEPQQQHEEPQPAAETPSVKPEQPEPEVVPVAQHKDGGALALTGANAVAIGAGGGVLLLLGVVALLLVRRRPHRG